MENNKKTLNLSEAIKLQTGLIQLALVTDRQDLLNIATDRLEKLINLIPKILIAMERNFWRWRSEV